MSQPGTVPRSRPSRGATVPAPLRVTAERVPPEGPDAERATPTAAAPSVASVPEVAGTEVAAVVGMSVPDAQEVAHLSAVEPDAGTELATTVGTSAAPLRPQARGSAWARLAALVTGRGRDAGRHRPDAVRTRGWSMFAPQRGPGRRRSPLTR